MKIACLINLEKKYVLMILRFFLNASIHKKVIFFVLLVSMTFIQKLDAGINSYLANISILQFVNKTGNKDYNYFENILYNTSIMIITKISGSDIIYLNYVKSKSSELIKSV